MITSKRIAKLPHALHVQRLLFCLLDMHYYKVDRHHVWTCGRYPWDAHPVLWIARGSVVHQGLQMQKETAVTLGQSWTKVGPRPVKSQMWHAHAEKVWRVSVFYVQSKNTD
jgi:hypothetical protein